MIEQFLDRIEVQEGETSSSIDNALGIDYLHRIEPPSDILKLTPLERPFIEIENVNRYPSITEKPNRLSRGGVLTRSDDLHVCAVLHTDE